MKTLRDLVDVVDVNSECTVFRVKDDESVRADLICLGAFNGDEDIFRISNNDRQTNRFTLFTKDGCAHDLRGFTSFHEAPYPPEAFQVSDMIICSRQINLEADNQLKVDILDILDKIPDNSKLSHVKDVLSDVLTSVDKLIERDGSSGPTRRELLKNIGEQLTETFGTKDMVRIAEDIEEELSRTQTRTKEKGFGAR